MFFIAGTGHCGTKWLASVLNDESAKVSCFHEYRNGCLGVDWIRGIQIWEEMGFSGFNKYFDYMNSLTATGMMVGDSNSWTPKVFQTKERSIELLGKTSIEKVIFLVRDGIKTVNSNIMHNRATGGANRMINQVPSVRKNYERQIFQWQSDNNIDLKINLNNLSKVREACVLIGWSQVYSEAAIQAAFEIFGDILRVVRLEDLTTNVDSLSSLLREFRINKSLAEIRELQETDINRKVRNQDINYILSKWDNILTDQFLKICSKTMEYHGYDLEPLYEKAGSYK